MSTPPLHQLPAALSDHVGYLLVRVGKHAQRLFSEGVAPLGLRPAHCDVLFTLAERGAQSQVHIADTLGVERAHLVALLDQLGERGLVRRDPDPTDRRRHSVLLTPEGQRVVDKLGHIAEAVQAVLLAELTASEQAALRGLLQRLARDADEGD